MFAWLDNHLALGSPKTTNSCIINLLTKNIVTNLHILYSLTIKILLVISWCAELEEFRWTIFFLLLFSPLSLSQSWTWNMRLGQYLLLMFFFFFKFIKVLFLPFLVHAKHFRQFFLKKFDGLHFRLHNFLNTIKFEDKKLVNTTF